MSDRWVVNEEKNLSGPKETSENEQKLTQDSEMYYKWKAAADVGPQRAGLRCYATLCWKERNPHTFVLRLCESRKCAIQTKVRDLGEKSGREALLTWLHWQRNYENSCGNCNSAKPWHILSPASPSVGYSFSVQLDQWFSVFNCTLGSLGELLNFLMLRLHSHPHHLKWLPGDLAGISICSRPLDLSRMWEPLN